MILVIGSKDEFHSKFIYDKLLNRGEAVEYLDTRKFPNDLLINWYAAAPSIKGTLKINDKYINIEDIKSVYWRWYYGIRLVSANNSQEAIYTSQMQERECTTAIESLFASLNCLWVNSIDAIHMHKKKIFQLNLMATNGIRVPRTLITNDKDKIVSFFEENDGEVIYKPVRGGASTQKLLQKDLTEERLESLKYSPVQFQELIDGVDIRIYGIKDKLYAAEIHADTIDFRDDKNAKIIPVELPEDVRQNCFKIMERFDLNFTGIDVRKNAAGEYVFIEANPSPMFAHFERMSGYPISDDLCDLLIEGKSS